MNKRKILNQIRLRRKKHVRAKIFGTALKPRLSVFRSNRHTYSQLIDDEKGITLVSVSSKELKNLESKTENSKINLAGQIGESIAKKAVDKGVKEAIFDRRRYKYHGRVRAVAEGARKGGLQI